MILAFDLPPAYTVRADEVADRSQLSTQRAQADSTEAEPLDPETLPIEELSRRLPSGRYAVERLIASGGSGSVYLAYDHSLRREVAIKVLGSESLRDRQRFLREARMLAELQHPNVVRVFDFGSLASSDTSGGRQGFLGAFGQHYIVMEYVPGGTAGLLRVGSWKTQQLDSRGPMATEENFDFRRTARLLATAADGLAAAHRQQLVHRDVKPGNLLLDLDWSAIKVADFGLARLAADEATQLTRSGDILGTPVFMSPEQVMAGAEITFASDIYSLGATLYQLMTGIAPYQGGPEAILRQVAESSPVAPRWINASIPTDLETICLHAMEHSPSARYPSMDEFAADLRRFARDEPIHAKPVSSATKAIRFLRRNRSLAVALGTCALLAALLTTGSVLAAVVFHNQNKQLELSAGNERSAKLAAENALKASITAADELLLAVTTETEFLPRTPGSQEVTRKLLERARDYFQSFLEVNAGNSALTYQLARAHAGLGEVAMRVGDSAALERETAAALALIELIPEEELNAAQRAELKADTLVVFANHLTESGEAKRAIPLLEEAIETCRQTLDRPVETSEGLVASQATAILGLANAFTWVGKREDAIPLLRTAKAMFSDLRVARPDVPTYLRNAAACDMTMATIALDLNQAAVGKQHLIDAMEVLDQVDEGDAISLRIRELKIKVLTNLALADRRMGNNVEAKAGYEAAMAESRRLIELEPGVPSHQWNLVVAALNSGGPDMELGNLEPLVERWQATVPVIDQLIENDSGHQRYRQVKAMLQSNIAIILRDLGKLEEAIEPLQSATETLRQQALQLDNSPEAYLPVALNHYELASTWMGLERWEEVAAALDASDAIVGEILASDPAFTPARGHQLDALHTRCVLLCKTGGEMGRRIEVAKQAVELARELNQTNPEVTEYQLELPRALNDLSLALLDSKQFARALTANEESQRLLEALGDNQETVSADYKSSLKNALLVQMRGTIAMASDRDDPTVVSSIDRLQERARELGASTEELAECLNTNSR
jgi:serine/threonine protein kinase